jgi:hypothetical protein
VLGGIDWEAAFAGPWEVAGDFIWTLSAVSPAMDTRRNYDEKGCPRAADLAQKFGVRRSILRLQDKRKRGETL